MCKALFTNAMDVSVSGFITEHLSCASKLHIRYDISTRRHFLPLASARVVLCPCRSTPALTAFLPSPCLRTPLSTSLTSTAQFRTHPQRRGLIRFPCFVNEDPRISERPAVIIRMTQHSHSELARNSHRYSPRRNADLGGSSI